MIRASPLFRRVLRFIALGALFFFAIGNVTAQTVDFSIPSSACLSQSLYPTNNSTIGDHFEWDFCEGDLANMPTALSGTSIGGAVTTGIDIVFDGVRWYGFVTSMGTNSILRLDFGSDINSVPSIVNLGSIGGMVSSPVDVKIISEGGNWYGFVYQYNAPLIRINFGNSLSNTTSGTTPISATTLFSESGAPNGGFDMIHDGSNWVMVLTRNTFFTIIRLPSVSTAPGPTDILTNINNPYSSFMGDVVLQKYNGNYFGYTVAFGNRTVQAMSFGNSIFTPPAINDLTSFLPSGLTPYGVDIGHDNGIFYLFVSTLEGDFVKINLGTDLSGTPDSGISLGKLGVLSNTIKFRMVKHQSTWRAFSTDYNSSNLYSIQFQSPCGAVPDFSTQRDPSVKYLISGQRFVGLKAYTSASDYGESNKMTTITTGVAPDISFTSQNICTQHDIEFTHHNTSNDIQDFLWDFGDSSGTSVATDPVHQYASAGTYTIRLQVTATNTCINTAIKTIKTYDAPVSSFTVPAGVICTNNALVFVNTIPDTYDGNLSYEWFVNNTSKSTQRDFAYTFTQGGNTDIKLRAMIPGCQTESTQNIPNIGIGPTVDFSFIGICQSTQTQFTNLTIGSVQTYAWDFSDGNTSSIQNPQNTYTIIGDYSVKLTATNAAGCNNTATKTISIKSKPQPNFSLDLPPFSCNGSLSQFNDTTPTPTDSNISSWLWSFGDALNGTSTTQHAKYTYTTAGQYNVLLTTTTNFGCTSAVQKQITIQQSPLASFTNSPACVNQGTNFVDTSSGNIKSRLWTIGGSTFTTPTVSNVFVSPGSFQAQLTVTANNNCVATSTKTINVPVPPAVNFSVQNNCTDQTSIFTDTTPASADPVATRIWDFANQGTATGSPAQHVFSAVGTYSVKLTVTNQSGCAYPITKAVAITKTPTANFTASPQSGPPPLAVQFNNTSANATSYLWQFNDAAGSTSNQLSPSFTFTTLGDYLVKLTATSLLGCQDTFSKEINVIVPHPDLAIDRVDMIRNTTTGTIKMSVSIRNKGNSIISGSSLLLDASGASLLKENVNDVIRPGETLVYVTHAELVLRADEIKYLCAEVSVTDDKDLSNNKECLLVEDEIVYFPAYPNPSHGLLYLDWIAANGAEANVLIVNSFGQKVYSKQIDATREGLNQLEFDVSNLGAGEYILVFQIERVKKSFRFTMI